MELWARPLCEVATDVSLLEALKPQALLACGLRHPHVAGINWVVAPLPSTEESKWPEMAKNSGMF